MPPASSIDGEVCRRTSDRIWRLARKISGSDADADDVAQDTWLAVLRAEPGGEPPRAWTYRVATNLVRKRHRSFSRRRRRERLAARPEIDSSSPLDRVQSTELREQLVRLVAELPDPYGSTLSLRYFGGRSLAEIAAAHGVSVNTVKTRVHRGLARLRARMDHLPPRRKAWTVVAGSAEAASRSSESAAAIWTNVGAAAMSAKNLVTAVCVSALVVAGVGFALRELGVGSGGDRPSPSAALNAETPPKSAGDDSGPLASDRRRVAAAPVGASESIASGAADEKRIEPDGVSLDEDERELALRPASSPEAAAMRVAYDALKKAFGEGGGGGWKAVREHISETQQEILGSDAGLGEFLALIDAESDGHFLEALMHHLPMAATESRSGILADEDLHREIWDRFEAEEDATKRMAFLRFFAFNRKLNSTRMDTFLEVARTDPAESVRQLSIDAIASNRPLIEDTWETLAHVFEHDASVDCRRTAVYGLALVEDARATALVHSAFQSPEEAMRSAALESTAGESLPEELTGGDAVSYLASEFRAASSPAYKSALVRRLLEQSPEVLAEELRQALPNEKDWRLKREYRDALTRIADLDSAQKLRSTGESEP